MAPKLKSIVINDRIWRSDQVREPQNSLSKRRSALIASVHDFSVGITKEFFSRYLSNNEKAPTFADSPLPGALVGTVIIFSV